MIYNLMWVSVEPWEALDVFSELPQVEARLSKGTQVIYNAAYQSPHSHLGFWEELYLGLPITKQEQSHI
jgi:hypothetical protein